MSPLSCFYRRNFMNRLQEEFFDIYGYRGDADELREFKSEQGYDLFSDYGDNNYRASSNRKQECSSNDIGDADDVGSEFSALFRDILGQSKKHKKAEAEGTDAMMEFAFMLLVFIAKSSLFFVLRYCDQKGYCTDL